MQTNKQPELDYKKYLALITANKRLFVVIALSIMTCAVIASYVIPKKYEANSTVFIEKNVISDLVKGIAVSPSIDDTLKVLNYAITSRTLLLKVIDNLDLNVKKRNDSEVELFIKDLQTRTKLHQTKENNLFTISFIDGNPKLARDYVNTLVRMYIEENVTSKRGESYDATKFLSDQIDTYKEKLSKAESAINDYKRVKGGVISVDEGNLFKEINLAQQKLYDLELRRRQLEGMRHVTKKVSDPLNGRLLSLEKRLEELRLEYTDNFPEVVKVKGEIEEVKILMKSGSKDGAITVDQQEMAKAESEIAALKVVEDGLRRNIATNQALLRAIPSAKAGLEKLEVEKNSQKQLYDQLYVRHGQSEVSKQMEVQDKTTTFRIVDPAIMPTKPVSPNRLMIMLGGIVAGLAGAFGVLFLMDSQDRSIKDVEFLKGFGLPVLGIIPHLNDQQEQIIMKRRDRKLYVVAGIYLLFILFFVGIEAANLQYVDKAMDRLQISEKISDITAKYK